jgi:hypothetical protein
MRMTMFLVPRLKEFGYRFIRLDEAPPMREAVATCRQSIRVCR